MKKRTFCLILAIGMLLSGCVGNGLPNGETSHSADKNFQNKYGSFLSGVVQFAESEGAFYGLNGGRLCYYDRQSGISGILCPDPSCTHEDETCGAFLQVMPELFCLYDEKLYWLGRETNASLGTLCLHRCDPDGTNHEKVRDLDYEALNSSYTVQQWALHRDKLFFYSRRESVKDTQAALRFTFGYIAPDSDAITVLYEADQNSGRAEMFFTDNAAYFALSNGKTDLTVLHYDLTNDTSEEIFCDSIGENRNYRIWVTEEDVLLIGTQKGIYEIQNGNAVQRFAFTTADDHIYFGDDIAMLLYLENGYRKAEIRNFDGDLLYAGKLFPAPVDGFDETLGMWDDDGNSGYSIAVLGSDSEKLIVAVGKSSALWHVFSLDICDNMKATHLWTIGTATMYEPD